MCMTSEKLHFTSPFCRWSKPVVAYKVVRDNEDGTFSPCMQRGKDSFFVNKQYKHRGSFFDKRGFYGFEKVEDARTLKYDYGYYSPRYVIVKVELRGIMATGQQFEYDQKGTCYRAKFQTIVEVVE